MSQRERQTPGRASPTAQQRPGGSAVSTFRSAAGNGMPSWEEIYQSAPAALREQLLSLAERQGVLYSHQLPAITPNGAPAEPCRRFLTNVFNGHLDELEVVAPGPVEFVDTELDA